MRRAAASVLIVGAIVAIFSQVASFAFIHLDDPPYVSENAHVLSGLSGPGVRWAFTTRTEANWHPLTWLSLQLDAELSGPGPKGFHLTNVVLHAAAALLLFSCFERMTGAVWRSALVALLFAAHPLHVESVAWIAERKDVLSAALGFLACRLWIAAVLRERAGYRRLALAAYVSSLLAKPMLVTLPVLWLLLDVWPFRRTAPMRTRILEKLPFFAAAVASSAVTLAVQSAGGATRSLVQYPLTDRLANAAVSYVAYLMKAVQPVGLSVYYPYPAGGVRMGEAALAALGLAVATALAVRLRRAAPVVLVGWLWYLIGLLPVIGLVQVGSQSMADRYTYVPLVGIFAIAAFGVGMGASRRLAPVLGAAAAVIAALYGGQAWRQVGFWRDSVTLFGHAITVTKDNAVAENAIARALFERGDIHSAVAHCREAVRIAPGMPDAEANLVRGLLALGDNDEAAARTQDALRDRPNDSRTHVNAGLIARLAGRNDDAIASFTRAVALDSADQEAHLNLGAVLAAIGRRDEAIAQFEEAVSLRPGDVRASRALSRLREAPP